jgi:hypothetical protein
MKSTATAWASKNAKAVIEKLGFAAHVDALA